ncbi:DUF6597 domain-containing transcriptional factor [Lacrimispora amygdalina]|uniref:DUF6597 domain-containing transcriptional factor n=1 Tax=Lacrimispora amygdalina TaxID=253257 RepID=UPI000BE3F077|nr:DUF6597 domain-containing transcriptional factor [Lacrimispora amygdalina]
MEIKQFGPSGMLQNFVDYIWVVESELLKEEEREDIIMPLGHINLIFNYGSDYKLIEREREILIPDTAIIGQIKSARHVRYGSKLEQIGISLKPAGLISFFHIPGTSIADRIIDAKEVDLTLHKVYHQIEKLNGIDKKVDKIYEYLKAKMIIDKNSRRISEMTDYIESNYEDLNINEMAEFFRLSISALERFFKKSVGLTPKTYGNIIKFRKNIENEDRRKHMQNYYYDQSHLIKNAKKFSGKTANELEHVNSELTLQHILNSNGVNDCC